MIDVKKLRYALSFSHVASMKLTRDELTELLDRLEAAERERDEYKRAAEHYVPVAHALAAHVERLREVLRTPTNQYDLWTQDGGFDRWVALALETLDDETPTTTSLARRDALKQVEGALDIRHLTKDVDWDADELCAVIDARIAELRRQAEGKGDGLE